MKVFLSWSGEQSKGFAEIFRQWLPAVLQAVRPYFSPDDIAKGTRWGSEIAKELEGSKVGLIFLTRGNLDAPWIMFETGALTKNVDKSKVCPILFGIEPTDIQGPLVQFQASKFEKSEVERVVRMINAECAENALDAPVLDSVFEMWWPVLELRVRQQLELAIPAKSENVRSERELLEEILLLSRKNTGERTVMPSTNRAVVTDLVQGFIKLVEDADDFGMLENMGEDLRRIFSPINYLSKRYPNLDEDPAWIKTRKEMARFRKTEPRITALPESDVIQDRPTDS